MTSSISDINCDAVNKEVLKALLKLKENSQCADCQAQDPSWASVNLGIFLCIVCSGIHRSLGTHISRIKSVELDSWKAAEIETFKQTNNVQANEFWEAMLPIGFIKPTYADSNGYKDAWIRCKYEKKSFVPIEYENETVKRLNFNAREGFIYKKGDLIKNWKRRFMKFVGDEKLEYFKSKNERTPCGSISLKNTGQIDSVNEVDGKSFCFIISTPKRRYLISCDTREDMFVWIQNIRKSSQIVNCNN
ncbi:hypothetical protein DICPUDRAFT_153940 [Dictyostelium purpureum]|uniref:Arf-GAP domain-containing protein n=1 Tax=Dictyostelium purpureum TaxID=5786 RepID=F0ZQ49_DICPU|nr:uncharacterized protein DICPUDRAFT_153940 [Dictyostelium purpureum]EGC33922.1 hypothetical protein DICPUDRAFT_153940 [Dictyostelium purpureum]|eukprot:XP_003289557.1 hypothetical protein DICPUDRAFT_153940 [Dictyostelium purpureum]